jgi:hypothetical protein
MEMQTRAAKPRMVTASSNRLAIQHYAESNIPSSPTVASSTPPPAAISMRPALCSTRRRMVSVGVWQIVEVSGRTYERKEQSAEEQVNSRERG